MRRLSGLGTLTTPDRTIWMPGDVRSWLNQINEQVRALDNDIDAHRSTLTSTATGQRFITDFDTFQRQWLSFNGSAATWWGNTVSEAQQYVNMYNALETRYRSLVGSAPTSAATLSEAERPSVLRDANRNLMLWAGLGILGLGTLGYVLSNWARIKTLSRLTNNRGRRRGRRRRSAR